MERRNSFIITKGFRHYVVATILYAFAEQLCTVLDLIFVGNIVASDAFSALDLVLPFETCVTGLILVIVGGASIVASRHIGNQDFHLADKTMSLALVFSAALSAAISIIVLVFLDGFSHFICNDASLVGYVHDYLRFYVLSLVPMALYFSLTAIIDVDGKPKLATEAVVLGCIVDIAFDLLFMKKFGIGVEAVAYSNILSFSAPILLYIPYLGSDRCRLRFRFFSRLRDIRDSLKESISYGVPYALPYLITFLMSWFVNSLVLYKYGSDGVYIWGVGFQVLSLGFMIMDSMGRTVLVTMGSMLFGSSDYHGLAYLARRCNFVSILSMSLITVFVCLFPFRVSALFGGSMMGEDSISNWTVRCISLFLIPYALCCIKAYVSQVIGHKKRSILLFGILMCLTLSGIIVGALLSLDNIFITVPISGMAFLIADYFITRSCRLKNRSLSSYFLIPRRRESNSLFLSVPYTEAGMVDALERIRLFLEGCSVSEHLRTSINICCEEMVFNLIRFNEDTVKAAEGYFFDIFILEEKNSIKVKVQDAGLPFNPVRHFAKGTVSTDDQDISLQLLNNLCRELEYNYLYGQNTVYMNFSLE